MKLYIACILSAALHIALGLFISLSPAKVKSVDNHLPLMQVSFKSYPTAKAQRRTSAILPDNTSTKNNQFADYLSEQEVELKAIPTSNIDQTKLNDVLISGLPIPMRLYINREGNIIKIDKLAVLPQDRPLQEALAKVLLEISFFPAKKNGIDVNSYKEIAFEFR